MLFETIFGYGSLVNAATHDYGQMHLATLKGWRREWHPTRLRDLVYLSAVPDANSSIAGALMVAPKSDPKLERREAAYQRSPVGHLIADKPAEMSDVSIFAVPKTVHVAPSGKSAIPMSYLDVVVQGYFRTYGEAGVAEFFENTHGWGSKILKDRTKPMYPRNQILARDEQDLTDHWLKRLSAQVE